MIPTHFQRIYVEITNCCNLRCDFCPGTRRTPGFLAPADFDRMAPQLKAHTDYVYLHVMGEPLLHPALGEILDLCEENGLRACVTTNGTLLPAAGQILRHRAIHKVSVSLHSMEGNGREDLSDYLSGVWDFCRTGTMIRCLRLWNLGGADRRNGEILDFLRERLGRDPLETPATWPGVWVLGDRFFLEQAERFDWPDLRSEEAAVQFCQGLRTQAAVLVDGTVVPCCLDHEGDIPLGNLLERPLEEILAGPRTRAVYDGFSRRRPTEELCRRCGYATRFSR